MTLSWFLCLLSLLSSVCVCDDTLVQTTSGPVRGYASAKARYFLGIPFASPPVGALRWQDPQPPTPWSQPLAATQYGFGCPQVCSCDSHCIIFVYCYFVIYLLLLLFLFGCSIHLH
jgi:hypothetical protein